MFHLSRIPQARLDAIAGVLCETVEEVCASGGMGLVPESHLYLAIQKAQPSLNIDDWQAIAMTMVATGRVKLSGNAFRVKAKRVRKAKAPA